MFLGKHIFRISHVALCPASQEAKGRCWSCCYRTMTPASPTRNLSDMVALTTVDNGDCKIHCVGAKLCGLPSTKPLPLLRILRTVGRSCFCFPKNPVRPRDTRVPPSCGVTFHADEGDRRGSACVGTGSWGGVPSEPVTSPRGKRQRVGGCPWLCAKRVVQPREWKATLAFRAGRGLQTL